MIGLRRKNLYRINLWLNLFYKLVLANRLANSAKRQVASLTGTERPSRGVGIVRPPPQGGGGQFRALPSRVGSDLAPVPPGAGEPPSRQGRGRLPRPWRDGSAGGIGVPPNTKRTPPSPKGGVSDPLTGTPRRGEGRTREGSAESEFAIATLPPTGGGEILAPPSDLCRSPSRVSCPPHGPP